MGALYPRIEDLKNLNIKDEFKDALLSKKPLPFKFVTDKPRNRPLLSGDAKNRRAAHVQDTKPTHGGGAAQRSAVHIVTSAGLLQPLASKNLRSNLSTIGLSFVSFTMFHVDARMGEL